MSRRYDRDDEREQSYRSGEDRERYRDSGRREDDRGFINRAGDQIRSWFGDEEAERRRRMDEQQYGRRQHGQQQSDYRQDYSRGGQDYRRDYGQDYRRDYGQEYGQDTERYRRGTEGFDYGRDYWKQQDSDRERTGGHNRWDEQSQRQNYGGETFSRGSSSSSGKQSWQGWQAGQGAGRWESGSPQTEGWQQNQRQNFIGRGPRNYKRSDERITEDVNEQLTRHHMIDASDIEVTCREGEVTLTGTVETREMKRLAEDIAENVWGVREVHNQIRAKQWQQGKSGERAA
jgi:osmotically-inducible protein OsmY